MPSKAKQRRQAQLEKEEQQKQIKDARIKLLGLMLVFFAFLAGMWFLPPATTPLIITALCTLGAIGSLIAIFLVAQPILRQLQEDR